MREAQGIFSRVWHCVVAAEVPLLKRVFSKIETKADEAKLTSVLESILTAEGEIELVPEP